MSQIRVGQAQSVTPEVLLVDDDDFARRTWRLVLERHSFRVREAANGEEALAAVDHRAPDLVLLDMRMPGMSGKEVCKRLKESQRTETIPIIVLTGEEDIDARLGALETGANDYLVKAKAADKTDEVERELVHRVKNALRLRVDNREGNPLSGLPGNAKIERELSSRIATGEALAFMFIDIDHFKAYNDFYGYQRGDVAIRRTADLIVRTVDQHGGDEGFVGHVGGDDFVAMTTPEAADAIAEELVRGFDELLADLFDSREYDAGKFSIVGRTGAMEDFRLMSLTIAVVTNEVDPIVHPAQVNDRAMELKQFGKKQAGNFIARERRGWP